MQSLNSLSCLHSLLYHVFIHFSTMQSLTSLLYHHSLLYYTITHFSTIPSLTSLLCNHSFLYYTITHFSTMQSLTSLLCNHSPLYYCHHSLLQSPRRQLASVRDIPPTRDGGHVMQRTGHHRVCNCRVL